MGVGVYLSVLGPVRAWRGGLPVDLGRVGQRAVLGLLALSGQRPLTRAELVDALWPQAPPPSAANVIQTHLRRLRQVLEPDRTARAPSAVLPAMGDGYALRLPASAVDVGRFRHLVAAGSQAAERGEHASAAELLGSAIELWQGPPLADVALLAGHPAVVMLVRQRQVARTRYAEAMIAAGVAVEALPMLEQWAGESPLDEGAHALLIRALHLTGQRWQALAVYRAIRRRLVDELGVEPGVELAAAHTAALDTDRGLTVVPARLPPTMAGAIGNTGTVGNTGLANLGQDDDGPAAALYERVIRLLREFGARVGDAGGVGAVSPFFIVDELPRALEFYRDRLGFDVTFTAGDDGDGEDGAPFFAIVRRNDAQFLLKAVGEGVGSQPNRTRHPYARWDAFVYVPDPDALATELDGRGVVFTAPLADTDDGLRGFEVADADGYLLFFGRPG